MQKFSGDGDTPSPDTTPLGSASIKLNVTPPKKILVTALFQGDDILQRRTDVGVSSFKSCTTIKSPSHYPSSPLRALIMWPTMCGHIMKRCECLSVCPSVCLSVTCHISKTEPDRAIVTMDHYIEVGCN